MRRWQQKQILDLIKTLIEANSKIKNLLARKEIPSVIQLITDCQHGAVQIGNFIEAIEGEGTLTVSCLEEYCELLYNASLEASNANGNHSFIKHLYKKLIKIENCVKDELKPNKIEIAFFPYKASMWDTFESIWLAAKDDPQCDAYVIPIPYYDRLPGGAFGQMHYEGHQYPEYVQIADWRFYNTEERRPDVIFVHNPYDNNNYVTSVHPDYYSERLKKHTDLLCYVPYFVSTNDAIGAHFVTTNGVIYADRVFLQSEETKRDYTFIFKEFEKENRCVGRFGKSEEKFVALGSPKFDKVINSRPEDFEIPEAWKNLIDMPDGTKKKIVLYNTSVGTLLQGNEQCIKKLQYVLDIFRKRDDVVLLWRPHPLSETTLESMRPNLLEEYRRVVMEYKREEFGIYDDTTDLHRAIALSDCYYGDPSSLVSLYYYTGNPIMLQRNKIFKRDGSNVKVEILPLCDAKDSFYFLPAGINALFHMDKNGSHVEYIGAFPKEKKSAIASLYCSSTVCGNKLYFASYGSDDFAAFDLSTSEFLKIPFKKPDSDKALTYNSNNKFCGAASYKKHVYFTGKYYPAIVRYDTATGKIDYFDDCVQQVNKLAHIKNVPYFSEQTVVGSELAIACAKANAVVIFDMEQCTSAIYEVGNKGNSYSGICFDGNNYWLTPFFHGPIVRWNRNTGEWCEFNDYPKGFLSGQYSFAGIGYAKGCVWILPAYANMALKIDVLSETLEQVDDFLLEGDYSHIHYTFLNVHENKIYSHSLKKNCLVEYDCETGKMREIDIIVSEDDCRKAKKALEEKTEYTGEDAPMNVDYENAFFSLEDFLDGLASDRQKKARITDESGSAGKRIYEYCKGEVLR